jgi:hypothetical protein
MAAVRHSSWSNGPWRALQGDLLYMIFFIIATAFDEKCFDENKL